MIYPAHSAVSAVMRSLRWKWVLIGSAVAFLALWDPINNWLNFEEVDVVVTAVNIGCAVETDDRGQLEGDRACDAVRAEFNPSAGQHINRRTQFSFDFISPVDGLSRRGSIVRVARDEGPYLRVGDKLAIQASKRAATLVRDIPR
jgi:hypothetical protein